MPKVRVQHPVTGRIMWVDEEHLVDADPSTKGQSKPAPAPKARPAPKPAAVEREDPPRDDDGDDDDETWFDDL